MFVGDLKNFNWEGGDWNGNLPKRLTSAFPPVNKYSYHGALDRWVRKVGAFYAQTDFDAYVARVTRAQILDFIEFCYGWDSSYTDPDQMLRSHGTAYLVEQLDKLKREVASLDDATEYGLVSECW
jgi:hypothetical protein